MVSFEDLIPQQPKAMPSRGRTFLEQGLAGATFNLADEAYNRLGAFGASLITGEDYGALLDEARGQTKQRMAEQMQERPALAIGSQLAGALLTGGAGATTKSGQAIANSLRTGGLGARIGKAGLLSTATADLAAFGGGEGFENRLDAATSNPLERFAIGAIFPLAGATAGKVAKQFQKAPSIANADEIKALANQAYKRADETGGVLKGWFTNRFLDDIADIKPASVAGQQVPTDPKLAEALEYIGGLKNKRLTLQDAQNLDEYLGDAIDGFSTLGQVNKSGQKLLEVQRRLRDAIENADDTLIEGGKEGFEALKEGRKLWSAQLRMRDIERIIQRAELTDNPATAIKTGFKNLLTNAKKSKGYSAEELDAIRKAAEGGPIQDTLRTFGSRLWTIAGGAAGGPLGAVASQAGSMASRGLATKNAMANAQNVARAVSQRAAPVSPQVGGLPAIIGSSKAGQLAAPAGMLSGNQAEPNATQIPPAPPNLDFNDLIPRQPSLKERISGAESSNNPNAQNPNSSASGLFQFTDSTWKSAVDKWGRNKGIKYSDKNSPEKQALMMDYLLQDNARILQNKGIEPNDANLYFAHFLGAPAASKAISLLGKNAIAARSFPDAARANKEVFFDGRRPRTIDEVYELITSKVV